MPCALMHTSGAPACQNASDTRKDERRAGQDKRNRAVEAESLDNTVTIVSPCSHLTKLLTRGTDVGKNELNEQALRWKFCMKQNNHVLGSLHACLNPSIELTGSVESPTRSRSMRACAISRSSGVSQEVVKGVLGRRKKPNMATRAVTAPSLGKCEYCGWLGWGPFGHPYMMKSHLHPAMPLKPSMPAKTPAAMRPEKPVARIWAQ